MNSAVCLFLFTCLLTGTQCRPNGAPNTACDGVGPNPTAHGAPAQISAVPYVLTGLPTNGNYTPGMSYTVTLRGNANEMFQGFLVVARNDASQRVGSFTSGGTDSKTTCSDMRGITHTGPTNKTSVSFTWMAPPEGTGSVTVLFSVAQTQTMYWSSQISIVLEEAQPEPEPSSPSVMTSLSPSPDMVSSSTSSVAGGDATSNPAPSSTATPGGSSSNSAPSNIAGFLAAILTAAIVFVMVAIFA